MTAKPQPNAMTIQPPFSAFERASRTAATTPSPRRTSSAVPMISAGMMSTTLLSPPTGGAFGTDGTRWRPYDACRRSSTNASVGGGWHGGGVSLVRGGLLGEERLELGDHDVTVRIRVDRAPE